MVTQPGVSLYNPETGEMRTLIPSKTGIVIIGLLLGAGWIISSKVIPEIVKMFLGEDDDDE